MQKFKKIISGNYSGIHALNGDEDGVSVQDLCKIYKG